MLGTEVTKNVIAPRRQARKERVLLISPNLGAFASLRESSLLGSVRQIYKNFKCLWLNLTQIEGEGKLRVDAGYTNVQFSGRVTEAEKAFKAATFGLKRVDGKDLVVASARVHNMVLATAEAAFHPVVDDIEDERRVHADGRVQCRGRLPRSVAHTCDEPADRPRRLQR